jgi:hypothetical protein
MKPSNTSRRKRFRLRWRRTAQLSKQSWKMTPFFCPGKLALRAIRTHRAKILRVSAPILVPASSARSVADETAAVIVAGSVDAVDAPTGAPIVPIVGAATVTVAEIAAAIADVDASSVVAADMDTVRIAVIKEDTRLLAGLN